MTPARRLTVALVGLIALVVIGYFGKDLGADPTSAPPATSLPSTSLPSGSLGASLTRLPPPSVAGRESGLPVKGISRLPSEAIETYDLILKGGPFPYPHNDGVTFENREKRLPAKAGDYYHEYTVPTPGSGDRGPRRLVTGSDHELYYTEDHYASFVVVDVRR